MSKTRHNTPRAAIHIGAPAKSFSAAEGYEPERRGWDENTYRLKNQDTNNHYDFSRKHLNFEISSEGRIVPLGSNPTPLHERLKHRLDELGFKPYRDKDNPLGNADNSPNCTVGIIVSGDHDVLTRLAFGNQDVDFTLQRSNAHIQLMQGIKDWAMDTYQWACNRWGADNIIAFDVHCDETTPHIHIQTIPVAKTDGAFAELLAEIQRIKSEGDLPAARELVEEFGVKVDKDLHQEVLERYKELNISPYKGFINPQYKLIYDAEGNIADVEIHYGEAYDHQMLRYGKI